MADNYKKAVLDRLQDAVTLYGGKRYIASLYMSGFVIEVGIKVELERLSFIEINDKEKLLKIINYLTDEQAASNSLEDFLKLIKQLQPEDKKVDKKFDFILTKRIGNHNTKEFLKGLNEWKHYVLGENRFNPADYDIENKCDWKTSLRYGDESKTNNSEQDDAKYALKMAINFLKNVVRLEDKSVVFECENKFSEINKSISQKSESISSVENEILSKEQTLNNED